MTYFACAVISPTATGPNMLLSNDFDELSPSIQQWPLGILIVWYRKFPLETIVSPMDGIKV